MSENITGDILSTIKAGVAALGGTSVSDTILGALHDLVGLLGVPVPAVAPGAPPLALDTFTRADDATHLGTAELGGAWGLTGPGSMGVVSGQATFAGGANESQGLLNAGQADVWFEAQLLHDWSDLLLRSNAAGTDYLGIQMQGGLAGYYSLGANGGITGAPRTDIHPAAGDVIAVACYGGHFVTFINGVPFNAASTATSAARLAQTYFGFRGFAQGFASRWANLAIRKLDNHPQVICDGDSLTYGSGAPADTGWPQQLVKLLPKYRGLPWIYQNIGIFGQLLYTTSGSVAMLRNAPANVDANFKPSHVRNVCALWGGTNDLSVGATTAASVYANLKTYWAQRKAAGWQVLAFTLLPRTDGGIRADWETVRQALNTLIKSDPTLYDGLVDVGADLTIGVAGASANTTYYNADGLHLIAAGYGVVAGLAAAAIAKL